MTIGERIRRIRKRVRVSQAELAHRIGLHEITIRRWEQGVAEPTISEAVRIAEALGVAEVELFGSPAERREFKLIFDREGEIKMEIVNMGSDAVDQRVMTVSLERIATLLNVKTVGLNKEEAWNIFLEGMRANFDDAWEQQEKWRNVKK